MWELDCEEGWALKNWCFRTVVLKTLESPLDCKEIKPVSPKENQPWIFIGRSDAEAEAPILWPPDMKNRLIWKDPHAGKDWRWEGKGMTEDEMVGWYHWLNRHMSLSKLRELVMDRETWRAEVHRVTKSQTCLSNWTQLNCIPYMCVSESRSIISDSLPPHGLYSPWNFPGQNNLDWVVFPFSRGSSQPRKQTQESNPGLPCCRQILYQLSHKGSIPYIIMPKIFTHTNIYIIG